MEKTRAAGMYASGPRRLVATVAAGALGLSMLAGCGGQAATEPAAGVDEGSLYALDGSSELAGTDGWELVTEAASEFPTGEPVELDEVLFDQGGLKVTATGFGPVLYYAALEVDIENTSDEALSVWVTDSSLNGWAWDASLVTGIEDDFWNEENGQEIAPGETLHCGIGFSNTYYLERCDIEAMAQIGFRLAAYGVDSGEEVVRTPELVVGIPGTEGYEQAYDASGTVAYDEGGITVVARDVESDGWGGYNLPLYLENLSGKDIVVQQVSRMVDGLTTTEEYAMEIAAVQAGRHALFSTWTEGELAPGSSYEFELRLVVQDPSTGEVVEDLGSFVVGNET